MGRGPKIPLLVIDMVPLVILAASFSLRRVRLNMHAHPFQVCGGPECECSSEGKVLGVGDCMPISDVAGS